MKLATSRFWATKEIEASGLLPVAHVVGLPRWKLPYELAANLAMLAPHGMFKIDDQAEFERLYRERLDSLGVEKIKAVLTALAAAHGKKGVALLCYETVHEGEWCHRRMFAAWWEEQTGEVVPELGMDDRTS